MSLHRLAGHKLYTSQEARTIRTMLGSKGSQELAVNIILTAKKRFMEDDRRALYRELNLIKKQMLADAPMWGYIQGSNRSFPYHVHYTDEQKELLEEVRKVEWMHSKKSYGAQEWQAKNRKKEYRRSAKNHYS